MLSKWAFVSLMWYICILCVQPQNRFLFLYNLHIADIAAGMAVVLHAVSASQEGRPIIRLGPATVLALALLVCSYISLHTGVFQTWSTWNPNIDIIFKNSLVLILIEATAYNVNRVWGVQFTLLMATLWWVKAGLRLSAAGATYSGDRIMGGAVSLIENPNAFAYLMAVMLPIYIFFFQQEERRKWLRYGFLGLVFAGVFIIFQTGSRSGFIALICLAVVLIPRFAAQYKAQVVVGGLVMYWVVSMVSPGNIERFRTIPQSIAGFLHREEETGIEAKAVSEMTQEEQSAWERRMKNKHTWELIKMYPVFGVGIDANDSMIPAELPLATGQVHNELLYAGKQMGFIGMGIYLGLIGTLIVRGYLVLRLCRNWWPTCANLGWTLMLQGVVFVSGGFFSPISWNPLFLILAGSASALLTNLKTGRYLTAPVATTPVPTMPARA